jgi:hypothetical protein
MSRPSFRRRPESRLFLFVSPNGAAQMTVVSPQVLRLERSDRQAPVNEQPCLGGFFTPR